MPPPISRPSRSSRRSNEALRIRLLRLEAAYRRGFLDSDPVGIVRRFDGADDREIVGLLAAGLAYGNVATIRRSVERLLEAMQSGPAAFLDRYRPARDASRFDRFAHRFTKGRDVALLLWLVKQARERSGSLEAFFLAGDRDPGSATLAGAMDEFGRRLFSLDATPFHPDGRVPERAGARWLLPLPRDGSVCKRHCLYLRWMVRPDDGIDCGSWGRVSPSRLVVPLDVHVQRVARALGWTRRRSPTWRMATEVTEALRALDPADPTRYDFALCRLGILGRLRRGADRLGRREVIEVIDDVSPQLGEEEFPA